MTLLAPLLQRLAKAFADDVATGEDVPITHPSRAHELQEKLQLGHQFTVPMEDYDVGPEESIPDYRGSASTRKRDRIGDYGDGRERYLGVRSQNERLSQALANPHPAVLDYADAVHGYLHLARLHAAASKKAAANLKKQRDPFTEMTPSERQVYADVQHRQLMEPGWKLKPPEKDTALFDQHAPGVVLRHGHRHTVTDKQLKELKAILPAGDPERSLKVGGAMLSLIQASNAPNHPERAALERRVFTPEDAPDDPAALHEGAAAWYQNLHRLVLGTVLDQSQSADQSKNAVAKLEAAGIPVHRPSTLAAIPIEHLAQAVNGKPLDDHAWKTLVLRSAQALNGENSDDWARANYARVTSVAPRHVVEGLDRELREKEAKRLANGKKGKQGKAAMPSLPAWNPERSTADESEPYPFGETPNLHRYAMQNALNLHHLAHVYHQYYDDDWENVFRGSTQQHDLTYLLEGLPGVGHKIASLAALNYGRMLRLYPRPDTDDAERGQQWRATGDTPVDFHYMQVGPRTGLSNAMDEPSNLLANRMLRQNWYDKYGEEYPSGDVALATYGIGNSECKPNPNCPSCPLSGACRHEQQGYDHDWTTVRQTSGGAGFDPSHDLLSWELFWRMTHPNAASERIIRSRAALTLTKAVQGGDDAQARLHLANTLRAAGGIQLPTIATRFSGQTQRRKPKLTVGGIGASGTPTPLMGTQPTAGPEHIPAPETVGPTSGSGKTPRDFAPRSAPPQYTPHTPPPPVASTGPSYTPPSTPRPPRDYGPGPAPPETHSARFHTPPSAGGSSPRYETPAGGPAFQQTGSSARPTPAAGPTYMPRTPAPEHIPGQRLARQPAPGTDPRYVQHIRPLSFLERLATVYREARHGLPPGSLPRYAYDMKPNLGYAGQMWQGAQARVAQEAAKPSGQAGDENAKPVFDFNERHKRGVKLPRSRPYNPHRYLRNLMGKG